MTTSTISHTEIMQKVALLPIDTLPALDEFIARLDRRVVRPKKEPSSSLSPKRWLITMSKR